MANNRIYLQCKIKNCPGAIMLAKYYPQEEGAGWFQPNNDDFLGRLEKFFQEHAHEYDQSMFGGYQYELIYETPQVEPQS